MSSDPCSAEELWYIAQKKPKTEEAPPYRRDWLEYDYARQQLKLAGIDPWGKRPKPPAATPTRSAKSRKAGKGKKAKRA